MSDLTEGFMLMLIGMGIVFVFLIMLMIYMKLIPILSRNKQASVTSKQFTGDHSGSNKYSTHETSANNRNNTNQTSGSDMTVDIAFNDGTQQSGNAMPEEVIATIAAAIFSHTGKKPKQIVLSTPGAPPATYNVWGMAGRQEVMVSRDIAGQVGFQY